MSDLIDRAAAIDTDGLDEEIRCEMCRNPIHTNRGCDGNCRYDEKLYKKIIQLLNKRITPLPSAQPYSEADIQKMQDLEQAELDKAFELGKEEGRKEAQPEQQWIPCSERLPEDGENVLVTYKTTDKIHPCQYHDDGSRNPWYSYIDQCRAHMNVVLAWMPLPEPYREEGEE